MKELIDQVRETLINCPEVIAQDTEINATITVDSGVMTLDANMNYVLADSYVLEAWLAVEEEDRPKDSRIPGVQPNDQYYSGRLIEPRELPMQIPRPGQENPCTIDGIEGIWVWQLASEGAFLFDDILGTNISGYFKRT